MTQPLTAPGRLSLEPPVAPPVPAALAAPVAPAAPAASPVPVAPAAPSGSPALAAPAAPVASVALPSWRDTATRRAIIDVVESVSGDGLTALPAAARGRGLRQRRDALDRRRPHEPLTIASVKDDWATAYPDAAD